MSLVSGTRLGRYEVLTLIGAGAMGEVYRARDTRLGREVAVKTLAPRSMNDIQARGRFEREARAVAALSHPNILAIHDFGEADGVLYVVMELLSGATLLTRMTHGPLPPQVAAEYARQLVRGLIAAHAQGVIHRDLKPANVFVSSAGTVKILDFGLAAMTATESGQDSDADDTRAVFTTQPGHVLGTPAYMPPEQVRGMKIDERADLFSFGAVLYEMLDGKSPFAGPTPADAMSKVLMQAPPPLASGSALAAGLERVARRCLEKQPERRFASAVELLAALDALESGGDAAAPARPAAAPLAATYRSVAVLPLADVSADRQLAYLCDGLAEEIANGLMRVPGLRVAARTSTLQFKDKADDVRRIGSALNVDAVLTGSVRLAGTRLRVGMQLIGAADGYQLWSERFDCTLDDVFAVEDQVARAVLAAMQIQLAGAPSLLLARPRDPEAHALYLKGRYQWNRRTPESLSKSIVLFQQAIDRDPTYAEAQGALAEAYYVLGVQGLAPPHDVMPKVRVAAERALEIAGSLPGVEATLGCVSATYDWDWATARVHFDRARALDHAHPATHQLYAMAYLVPLGQFDAADTALAQALALDPLSLPISHSAGFCAYFAHRYERAVERQRQTLARDAAFAPARWGLGQALTELGQYAEAIAELAHAIQLSGGSIEMIASLGDAQARAGDREAARHTLARLTELSAHHYVPPSLPALVLTGLGETTAALDALEQAAAGRAVTLAWLGVRPGFDRLRGEPRFESLCRMIGVPSLRMSNGPRP